MIRINNSQGQSQNVPMAGNHLHQRTICLQLNFLQDGCGKYEYTDLVRQPFMCLKTKCLEFPK